MELVNKKVLHDTFGNGSVVNYDGSYIKVKFESGDKRFVFPDVFIDHLTFIDQDATELVEEKLEEQEKERKKREILLQKEKILEEERLRKLEEEKRRANRTIHPKIQSVFWCKSEEEEEEIFEDWKVFTGTIKSGQKKGEPRQLARMDENSGCLITKRTSEMDEKDRQILGLFLAERHFDGRECEDGYIPAHPDYRIQLTEEESEKMLFWKYYVDNKFPERTTWNSGRQRYFDNIWMAQILNDIVSLREESEGLEEAEKFFEHFCHINLIDKDNIPELEGALINIEAEKDNEEDNKTE